MIKGCSAMYIAFFVGVECRSGKSCYDREIAGPRAAKKSLNITDFNNIDFIFYLKLTIILQY